MKRVDAWDILEFTQADAEYTFEYLYPKARDNWLANKFLCTELMDQGIFPNSKWFKCVTYYAKSEL